MTMIAFDGTDVELGSDEFWKRVAENPAVLAAQICFVDAARIDETLRHHASLRAWIGAVYESARIDEERFKWELTKARASALLRSKMIPDPDTKKSKTVAVLDAEVDCDERVIDATQDLFVVQEKRGALRAMVDALEARRDMLIQIAARQRQEMKEYG